MKVFFLYIPPVPGKSGPHLPPKLKLILEEQTMKKLMSFVLVIALALSMVACAAPAAEETAAVAEEAPAEEANA